MITPTLTGIPTDLLFEIAEHLSDSPAALSALCRTNIRFCNDLTPLLYRYTAEITLELKIEPAYYLPQEKILSSRDTLSTTVTLLHRCALMGNTSAVEKFLMVPGERLNEYSKPQGDALSNTVELAPIFFAALSGNALSNTVELTPIFFAALSGNAATVAVLLARGANPNLPAIVYRPMCVFLYGTALDVAARQQNEEMVSLLLRHGATSKSALHSLFFPLRTASPTRLRACAASIAENLTTVLGGSEVSECWVAPYGIWDTPLEGLRFLYPDYWKRRDEQLHTFVSVLRVLLRAGPDVNYYLTQRNFSLNTLIRNGCVEILAAILEEAENSNVKLAFDSLGEKFKPLQVVAFLLRQGHYSHDGRLVDIARLLLRAGARPHAGKPTPLMLVDPEWQFFRRSRHSSFRPRLDRRMESRIFAFVALLKAYNASSDPLVCHIDDGEGETAWFAERVVPEDRQGDHGVAGTRFLQLKEVLEKEQAERELIQRVAEFGL